MRHVMVVGGGPAGLAAAEALLDEGGGGVDVTLTTLGHILGGKACSWTTEDDRVVEHGQHVLVGFYAALRGLLRRSGVDPEATTVSNDGRFVIWEDRDELVHDLHLGPSVPALTAEGLFYSGFTLAEKAAIGAFIVRAAPEVVFGVSPANDDLCFTAWCLERGMPVSFARTNAFRGLREVQMNWPNEVSAYVVLNMVRRSGRDYHSYECRYPKGGMSELWWEPVAARIEKLGGKVVRRRKLVGLAHEGGSLTGVRFAQPLPHPPEAPWFDRPVPTGPVEEPEPADAVIVAIPPSELGPLVSADPVLAAVPGLAGIPRLRTVAPIAMQVWHRERVTARWRTIVGGLEPPLPIVLDNKPIYDTDDDRFGAVLHFAGQETGYEDLTDEELLDRSLRSVRRVPGYESMTREGVVHFTVMRHRAPHKRYWDCEPGSLRFKPHPKTALRGLYLAGDWVRSELDFPCMESAVRSGREAARLVLEDLGIAR